MDSNLIEMAKWAFGIAGFGLFLWFIGSQAVAKGLQMDRERQEREKQEKGRRP
jgi:type IV secretory pathway TrbD component